MSATPVTASTAKLDFVKLPSDRVNSRTDVIVEEQDRGACVELVETRSMTGTSLPLFASAAPYVRFLTANERRQLARRGHMAVSLLVQDHLHIIRKGACLGAGETSRRKHGP
jgi:hypothetical protein